MAIEPEPAPASLWTAAESTAADRHTIEALGMPSAVLMERAALCVSAEVERLASSRGSTHVLVLVGPGNNGGDGLAVARQLHGRGRLLVTAALVTPNRNPAAEQQLALARAHGVVVLDRAPEAIASDTVVVDALLGTGSRGALRGPIAELLGRLGTSPTVAIDIPTGIDVDTGAVPGVAVWADVTVTFQRSKVGLHVTPGRTHAGRIVVADIGLLAPAETGSGLVRLVGLIEPSMVAHALASLPTAAHKGQRGHVGVIGGTGGTPGAAVLAGAAALRTGAGLVTLAMTDPTVRRALVELRPELMLADVSDTSLAAASVLVVGPGLTAKRQGIAELASDPRAMVWDASALDELGPGPAAGPRVLTPHPGEAARMLARLDPDPSWTSARVQADRHAAASRLAALTQAVVVLKGEASLVAQGDRLAIATTGNQALATAGSGDVLAGVIAALLARGLDAWTAACVGVHLHGLAGEGLPSDGTLALDLADRLPHALAQARSGWVPPSWPTSVRG